MKSLKSRLPPIKSLIAFEAVARHLSITRAGQELFISREAVSRQIRILEEHLGGKLFDRLHRAISLTVAGKEFIAVVQGSLKNIARASDNIQKNNQPFKITICATVAISSFWLTQKLIKYREIHPQMEFRVVVSDTPADMADDDVDISFRYGDGNWPGFNAVRLFEIDSFPVCSPDYLKKSLPIGTPLDLLSHNLVNLDGEFHAHEDWLWWLKGHDVTIPETFKTMGFDNYSNVIQVALDGQGIVLGFSRLTDKLLATNKLVRPLDSSLTTRHAVFLVTRSGIASSVQTDSFGHWIQEEEAALNFSSNLAQPSTSA